MDVENLEYADPENLIPYKNNARIHSKRQIAQIANSIERFGFVNPVLIDQENMIIAGHGRVMAAIKLGIDAIPVRRINHLSENEKRAYILADNKLAEKAGWDNDILSIELQHLLDIQDEVSIDLTGFEMPEIDMIILEDQKNSKEEDQYLSVPSQSPVTQKGDLWILGNHQIYCGDSLSPESFRLLLNQEKVRMVFTDPPYNVPVKGHVCGKGRTQHREFAMASGEMSKEEFTDFLETIFRHLSQHSLDGSLHYICMDWRHMEEILAAGNKYYDELKNLCIWNKNNGGMGSLYRSKHELIFIYKKGALKHINNVELGKHGRYRTNVWDYDGVNGKPELLSYHPTVKPVSLIADAILDCTNQNDVVLDCFGGSGSALLAAEKTNRQARLIELDPAYIDITIERWQKETGQVAIHAESQKFFEKKEIS